MSTNTDYYALLGVDRDATQDELKRAYRRKARELHPDANGGDPQAEALFKEVTRAYETLRDPERRRRYDMFGTDEDVLDGQRMSAGSFFGGGLGDLIDSFFGGGFQSGYGRQTRSMQGSDVEVTLELDFEEAIFGTKREVTVSVPVVCSTCAGSGARPGTSPVSCPDCRGSGEIRQVRQSFLGQMVTATACRRCKGTGEVVMSPCPECHGEGRTTEERVWMVDIPAGVDSGSTLRLAGRGSAGLRGGPPGDLYVHLTVKPDERFTRSGDELHYKLRLPMTRAALGTKITLDTFDKSEELVIPPGTQSGEVFRLRGRGVPHLKGRGRGDLLVHVIVETPRSLTKSQEELLRQFAAERGEDVPESHEGLFHKIRSAFS
ncbi:MAG: molecular chaperone DnaJ [Actinobacteria bacterium]|nr:molecular chaperone DnaJ [Actinomycetota bacterium]MCL6095061.1 molecular chaperone DnaJ [Actinomycetota bacterium]